MNYIQILGGRRMIISDYCVALAAAAGAFGLTWLLLPLTAPCASTLFFMAVFLVTQYRGLRPGLLAVLTSVVLSGLFLVEPLYFYSLRFDKPAAWFQLIALTMAALIVHRHRGARPGSQKRWLRICAWCKKIRDANAEWIDSEDYISKHSGADVTHGCCPACAAHLYSEIDNPVKLASFE